MFCNHCGSEINAGEASCSRCGSAFGLVGNSLSTGPVKQAPSPEVVARAKGYYFGRFYAWTKITAGLALGLMILFRVPWIAALSKPELEFRAVVSVLIGYGLLKKQIWALYLMTAGFFISIGQIMMADNPHTPVRLLPLGVLWSLIGLWYFWEHRHELK
jgi:hypothetical protein